MNANATLMLAATALKAAVKAKVEELGVDSTLQNKLNQKAKVLSFAGMLEDVSHRIGSHARPLAPAVRIVRKTRAFPTMDAVRELQAATVVGESPWSAHVSDSPLVTDFLPTLRRSSPVDATAFLLLFPHLHEASKRLPRGAEPVFQKAGCGVLTMPHTDGDFHTTFIITEGEEIFIAWDPDELDPSSLADDQLDGWAARLCDASVVRSLSVVHAKAGDIVRFSWNAAHMVITIQEKVHLAWHDFGP